MNEKDDTSNYSLDDNISEYNKKEEKEKIYDKMDEINKIIKDDTTIQQLISKHNKTEEEKIYDEIDEINKIIKDDTTIQQLIKCCLHESFLREYMVYKHDTNEQLFYVPSYCDNFDNKIDQLDEQEEIMDRITKYNELISKINIGTNNTQQQIEQVANFVNQNKDNILYPIFENLFENEIKKINIINNITEDPEKIEKLKQDCIKIYKILKDRKFIGKETPTNLTSTKIYYQNIIDNITTYITNINKLYPRIINTILDNIDETNIMKFLLDENYFVKKNIYFDKTNIQFSNNSYIESLLLSLSFLKMVCLYFIKKNTPTEEEQNYNLIITKIFSSVIKKIAIKYKTNIEQYIAHLQNSDKNGTELLKIKNIFNYLYSESWLISQFNIKDLYTIDIVNHTYNQALAIFIGTIQRISLLTEIIEEDKKKEKTTKANNNRETKTNLIFQKRRKDNFCNLCG